MKYLCQYGSCYVAEYMRDVQLLTLTSELPTKMTLTVQILKFP